MQKEDWRALLGTVATVLGLVLATLALGGGLRIAVLGVVAVLGFPYVLVQLPGRVRPLNRLRNLWLGVLLHASLTDGRLKYRGVNNVMVRMKTLQTILDTFANLAGPDEETSHLRKAGSAVGEDFAADFDEGELRPRNVRYPRDAKVIGDIWRRYEEDSGFASFDFSDFVIAGPRGRIVTRNSFLTWDRRGSPRSLCSFMEGYLEGFLRECTELHVEVKGNCGDRKRDHADCQFEVESRQGGT